MRHNVQLRQRGRQHTDRPPWSQIASGGREDERQASLFAAGRVPASVCWVVPWLARTGGRRGAEGRSRPSGGPATQSGWLDGGLGLRVRSRASRTGKQLIQDPAV